ncbi:MAG: hypothetical protein FWH02_05435 [Oscillospiraceae bacterium]|nr:hypothetical protein [Oscillospiraceae bacterium]
MSSGTTVKGYFGEEHGGSTEGKIAVSLASRGVNGTLSIKFAGRYGVLVPYKPIEQLAALARREAKQVEPQRTVEKQTDIDGFYCDSHVKLRPGTVRAWVRSRRGFDTLTVEFGQMGQISMPYGEIESLILRERRNYV